jgi:germination protein YpeB
VYGFFNVQKEIGQNHLLQLFAFALVGSVAIYQYREASSYKKELAYTYQRAFYNLINYVKTIDASLEKGVHSGSPIRCASLLRNLAGGGGAISSLSQLPLSDIQLEKLTKYLSQVGDYTHSLSRRWSITRKFPPTSKYLAQLSSYSRNLTQDLLGMEEQLNSGSLTLEKIKKAALSSEKKRSSIGAISLWTWSRSSANILPSFTTVPFPTT